MTLAMRHRRRGQGSEFRHLGGGFVRCVLLAVAYCLVTGTGYARDPLQDGLRPGLIAEYFKDIDTQSSGFPDIPLPSYRRIESQISVNYDVNSEALANIPLPKTFYVRWMGVIKIAKDGWYTFSLQSDGRSRLWIPALYGTVVVDNSGPNQNVEKTGRIQLKTGYHELKTELLANRGRLDCRLFWQAENQPKTLVPSTVLFHKMDPEIDAGPLPVIGMATKTGREHSAPLRTGHRAETRSPSSVFRLNIRDRNEVVPGSGRFAVVNRVVEWNPTKTAVIICDMWNKFSCKTLQRWVDEMAPKANALVQAARRRGALIIHAPADRAIEYYVAAPQRKRALEAPMVAPPVPIRTRGPETSREPMYPISDWDKRGECQCLCPKPPYCPLAAIQTRQHPAIVIAENDLISADGQEIYNILEQRHIANIIFFGLDTNYCVMWRSFGIRQLRLLGENVVLVRDLTDAAYNSSYWPYVSHGRGTELVIEHIEKYWCPTILSADITNLGSIGATP